MNDHEAQRIAAMTNALRPDWPSSSVLTLIRKSLMPRPRRDVAVALAWVACDSTSKTPARVLEESGPWWRAAAVENGTASEPYDIAAVCGICEQREDRCRASAYSEHEFESKVETLRKRVPGGKKLPPLPKGIFEDQEHAS